MPFLGSPPPLTSPPAPPALLPLDPPLDPPRPGTDGIELPLEPPLPPVDLEAPGTDGTLGKAFATRGIGIKSGIGGGSMPPKLLQSW